MLIKTWETHVEWFQMVWDQIGRKIKLDQAKLIDMGH